MPAVKQFLRYLIAGGVVVVVNLAVLFALTSLAHVYYLVSTVIAFLCAFCLSFVLQRSWTFRGSAAEWRRQLPPYLVLQLANLFFNTSLMYLFVAYLHLWYLISQIIISLALAMITFFICRLYIFRAVELAA